MKKLLLISIFMAFAINVKAQNLECGTNSQDNLFSSLDFSSVNQNVPMSSFAGLEPYVLKVHFWDVYDDNGENNQNPLTTSQMLTAVAKLNNNFNNFNIFFKYDGLSQINQGQYQYINADENSYDFRDYQNDNDLYFAGTINVYAVDNITNNNNQNIGGYRAWGTDGKFGTIVMKDYLIGGTGVTLTHETGHFFSLLHTFDCGLYGICENVTRDVNDPCYNADLRGDRIIDTNATPYPMSYNTSTCLYDSNGEMDDCGVSYNYNGLEPEVKNFMGYSGSCRDEFTPGQVSVMRWFIGYMKDFPGGITIIKNYSPEILYEPYAGVYAPYYPHPNPWIHPLFQPGFDYHFVECGGEGNYPQPADYSDTTFSYDNTNILFQIDKEETNFSTIVHPNHSAIRILQLNSQQPRKCYDNYNSPPVLGGAVIKFNDNIINTNVTITPKDSIGINDDYLINDLNPGLYNIIKNYESGDTQETLIFKEDN